jgi:hypothetical protein
MSLQGAYGENRREPANDGAITLFDGSGNIVFRKRTKTTLMHNKFIVRCDGKPSPDAVLMGSANFTEEGLTSQANLLHTWQSPALARLYQGRQKVLFADASKAETVALAGWSARIRIGDARVRMYFPPERKPLRRSIRSSTRFSKQKARLYSACSPRPTNRFATHVSRWLMTAR